MKHWKQLLIIFLPLVLAAALLYPTYRFNELEKIRKTKEFEARQKGNPTDSIAVMEKFWSQYKESYESNKKDRLKLGLDLRGGMYVTLEVDAIKLIEESAENDAIDEIFTEVIEKSRAEVDKTGDDGLQVFLKHFNKIAKPEGRSLISYFDAGDIKSASEEKIIDNLEANILSSIDQAQEVIRKRIDKYGVSEPNITKQGDRRILIELPGVENETEVRQLIQTTARLEFNLVRNDDKLVKAFKKIDEYLNNIKNNTAEVAEMPADSANTVDSTNKDTLTTASSSSLNSDSTQTKDSAKSKYEGLSKEDASKLYLNNHPFTRLFATFIRVEGQSPVQYDYESEVPANYEFFFIINEDSISKMQVYLNDSKISKLLPFGYKVLPEARPYNQEEGVKQLFYYFHGLKSEPELVGDVITDAQKNVDPTTNKWVVNMSMNSEGAEKWANITGANIDKRIAIVLDESVYSAPNVNAKITGGNSVIEGMAGIDEANLLEIVLKAGALKAPVKIIEERQVGASLGDDSITNGLNAALIAFILVVGFMLMYYSRGGLIADFALFINVALIITFLTAMGGTLTLPGIAGIILTIGMAVDANILIFERIREELAKGRTLKSAIDEGFSKAFSAIIDSNITTFITAAILYYMGTGLIQGFALTLMFGIGSTLFTGLVVTRAIINLSLTNSKSSINFGQPKH